jgi:hypothetical protein
MSRKKPKHGRLRTTPRMNEATVRRPPAEKRIDVEKVLSGDQQIEVVSATKSGSSKR